MPEVSILTQVTFIHYVGCKHFFVEINVGIMHVINKNIHIIKIEIRVSFLCNASNCIGLMIHTPLQKTIKLTRKQITPIKISGLDVTDNISQILSGGVMSGVMIL